MPLSDNARGALFMALAMASFAANDAIIKFASGHINVGQIMLVRGVMTTTVVFLLAWRTGALRHPRVLFRPMVLIRTLCEMAATITFMSALARMELANASAILQSLPLAITLGAALFLGEPVGWRRWLAIIAGFLGVMMIIKPGPDGFSSAALLAIAAVFFTATRDLVTRKMYRDVPSLTISAFTSMATTCLGAVILVPMGGWRPMETDVLIAVAAASVLILAGYQAIIAAMRSGEISFVAPFRYSSLIWAILMGIYIFGELPDGWTIAGATVVIFSGLYTFYRERVRKVDSATRQEA